MQVDCQIKSQDSSVGQGFEISDAVFVGRVRVELRERLRGDGQGQKNSMRIAMTGQVQMIAGGWFR